MGRNLSVATLLGVMLVPLLFGSAPPARHPGRQATDRPELAYLKQVNAWHPPSDPQLLFLLMQQYANAGRHLEGAAYLDELRRRFDGQLDDTGRALYLTAIASLRAGGANQVFVLKRIGWMRDTLAMLDRGPATDARRGVHHALDVRHRAVRDAAVLRRAHHRRGRVAVVPAACRQAAAPGVAPRSALSPGQAAA